MSRAVAILVGALALAGCGGAAPADATAPPPPPAAIETPPPATATPEPTKTEGRDEPRSDMEPHIRDAQAELERAERALDEAMAPPVQKGAAKEAAPAPSASPRAAADPCTTACMALASMRRSAAYLCKLAGEGDPRCPAARARVESAEVRVRARCPGCAS